MGFGRKMDYRNSRKINLDLTYTEVIKPLFKKEFTNYELIRADEICYSGSIDKDMYKLLLEADLVIADITTENANAIYELGVRHALRPASTIIIKRKDKSKLPFDIGHLRIIEYHNLEGNKNAKNVEKLKHDLRIFIKGDEEQGEKFVDSPVYEFLCNLHPPCMGEDNVDVEHSRNGIGLSIAKRVAAANHYMAEKNYLKAAECWEVLHEIIPQYDYVVQQWALTRYKSKNPNELNALKAGWEIINLLSPDKSLDIETLGIAGAICKRLNSVTGDNLWLEKAIKFYRKGYLIEEDYYTGENFANCLLRKTIKCCNIEEEKQALQYERKKVCENIITRLLNKEDEGLDAWEYASLATCNYHLRKNIEYQTYKDLFFSKALPWMRDTFNDTIKELSDLLKQ